MTFAIVVEDGTGLPNANSYVSASDADDILVTNIHNTDWFALDQPTKEKLLAWATRLLNSKAVWFGKKTYPTSALPWPRDCITTRDSYPDKIPNNSIPHQLKEATAEMARFLVEADRTTEQDRDGFERLWVDVIKIQFDPKYRLPQLPPIIWQILSELGYFSSATGAARIIRT